MDEQAVPVVSYARISADTARDEHGVADQHKVNQETVQARHRAAAVACLATDHAPTNTSLKLCSLS